MRTTINLADDVAAAFNKVRRERSIGVSEAVNELVRTGPAEPGSAEPFRQTTHDLGTGIDFSNVADAIDTVDGPSAR